MSKQMINRQREAILRFHAAMNNLNYDDVVNEYLGKVDQTNFINKLYQAVEITISYMNEAGEL